MEEVTQYFDEQNEQQYKAGQEVELMDFLNAYPWQAWMHGTAEPGTTFDQINDAVGAWRGRLAHCTGLRISSMGIFTAQPQPHCHVLLLGHDRNNRTMENIDGDFIESAEDFWKELMHRTAEFKILHDAPGAVRYIIQNNTIEKQSMLLSPRGLKLLQKKKKLYEKSQINS